MSKISLTSLVNLQNETSAVSAINNNNATLIAALNNTLSRDGTAPNQMLSTLDMNSHSIINLPAPGSLSEPITLGYLNTIVPGVVSGVSTISTYATRSLATSASIPATTVVVQTAGYAAAGDGGGTTYTRSGSLLLGGFQSADGQFWQPDYSKGINLRTLGAGQGSGVADVAAMTAALAATLGNLNNATLGYNILLTSGSVFDFSTGQFLIDKSGTRILGDGMRNTVIKFDPATPATLFTFHSVAAIPYAGLAQCEMSNLEIFSTNTIQKTLICTQNTTFFLLDRVATYNISSTAGNSIVLLYEGRNFLTVRDCQLQGDLPVYFYFNPDRASAGFEDGDFLAFERNQLTCTAANSACYTVSSGLNITNWSDTDSDWALGRYGIINIDTTADANSYHWSFNRCRREQEQGANPCMFVIHRSVQNLRDLTINDCASGSGALFDLSGTPSAQIERVNIENVTIFADNILIGQADSGVARLKWRNLFVQAGNTIAIGAGLYLVKGREKMGGTNVAPIYTDAEYTTVIEGLVEWLGPPSTTNSRRTGRWVFTQDIPVSVAGSDLDLFPFSHYAVQYATIRVSTSDQNSDGIANFTAGFGAPNGCKVLTGGSTFAVDGNAGHVSVFHAADNNVGIFNKLAVPITVTVEVVFTI